MLLYIFNNKNQQKFIAIFSIFVKLELFEKTEQLKGGKMIKDIYLMRVDGAWGAVIPSKCLTVINAPKSADLIEFYHELKSMFPEHRMRCVINKGIADKIRQHQIVKVNKMVERY